MWDFVNIHLQSPRLSNSFSSIFPLLRCKYRVEGYVGLDRIVQLLSLFYRWRTGLQRSRELASSWQNLDLNSLWTQTPGSWALCHISKLFLISCINQCRFCIILLLPRVFGRWVSNATICISILFSCVIQRCHVAQLVTKLWPCNYEELWFSIKFVPGGWKKYHQVWTPLLLPIGHVTCSTGWWSIQHLLNTYSVPSIWKVLRRF